MLKRFDGVDGGREYGLSGFLHVRVYERICSRATEPFVNLLSGQIEESVDRTWLLVRRNDLQQGFEHRPATVEKVSFGGGAGLIPDERSGHGRAVHGERLVTEFEPGRPENGSGVQRIQNYIAPALVVKLDGSLAFDVDDDCWSAEVLDLSHELPHEGGLAASRVAADHHVFEEF